LTLDVEEGIYSGRGIANNGLAGKQELKNGWAIPNGSEQGNFSKRGFGGGYGLRVRMLRNEKRRREKM
jgi:hypothetical protein